MITMKARTITITLILFGFFQLAFGQTTEAEKQLKTQTADTLQDWKTGGVIALTLAQTSLTNWAAGGENSVASNGLFSIFANYREDKTVWDNSLDMGYGILKQGKDAAIRKTDDRIDILSKYGRRAFTNSYYAVLLNFKTQMTPGYNYPNDSVRISNLLAPAYLLAAAGIDYRPNDYFGAFVAPVTGKMTIVNDQVLADAGAFGVTPAEYDNAGNVVRHGKKTRSELGGYCRVIYTRNDFDNEVLRNVSLTTKIDLFSNYLNNPQNVDVSWETQIAFNVNKYIAVNFNTHLLYDDDIKIAVDTNGDGIIDEIGPRTQFKEILGVGFAYKF
jgi:hypothetical protein